MVQHDSYIVSIFNTELTEILTAEVHKTVINTGNYACGKKRCRALQPTQSMTRSFANTSVGSGCGQRLVQFRMA